MAQSANGTTPTYTSWRELFKFRCSGCGNCCRGTVVMITDADVRRIRAGTGQEPQTFARFVDEAGIDLERRSPWWIRLGSKRRVMALQWKQRRCIFLDDATNRCQIYEHRPVTCREHPFEVKLSERGRVERLSLSDVVECPHEWDGDNSLSSLRNVVRWNEQQSDDYTAKVGAWNRQRRGRKTQPDFLRFLGCTD